MAEHGSHDRRKAILKAAQRRFAVYGLSKVTMDEIAADVGLGKASLYYYFPTKEAIFRAVVEDEQQVFVERLRPVVVREGGAPEKLAEYMAQRLHYFQELVNLNAINARSFLDANPLFEGLALGIGKVDEEMVTAILSEGCLRGELRVTDAGALARTLLHVVQGLALRSLRWAGAEDNAGRQAALRQEVREVVDLILQGILTR